MFKEISYLSLEEFRRLNQQIRQLANEPEVLRQKRKGDYLMEHGKYVNAIKVYQRALRREVEDDTEVTDIRKPEATEAAADHTVGVQEATEKPAGTEAESPVAITIDMMEDPQVDQRKRPTVHRRIRKQMQRRRIVLLPGRKNRKK